MKILIILLTLFFVIKLFKCKKENKRLNKENAQLSEHIDSLINDNNSLKAENEQMDERINSLVSDNGSFKTENEQLKERLTSIGADDYFAVKEITDNLSARNSKLQEEISEQEKAVAALNRKNDKIEKTIKLQSAKLEKIKELAIAANRSLESMDTYLETNVDVRRVKVNQQTVDEMEELVPSVTLKLHHMDIKDLRRAFKDNDKQITDVMEQYESHYNTKSNKTIYRLMIIALRAELQNILYEMRYDKLDKAKEDVRAVTTKYLTIALEGNQTIAPTLTKFIEVIEYFFIKAVTRTEKSRKRGTKVQRRNREAEGTDYSGE